MSQPILSPATVLLASWLSLVGTPTPAPAAPPRVAECHPDNGDVAIDPSLTEVRIVFDQEMREGSQSICNMGGLPLPIVASPRWEDARTVVLPVKLDPGRAYTFSVNCPSARGFQSRRGGEPAEMHVVTFRTRAPGEQAPPPLTPADARDVITRVRDAVDRSYAYRGIRNVDWAAAWADLEAAIEKGTATPSALARAISATLARAEDLHNTVRIGEGAGAITLPTHRRFAAPNIDVKLIGRAVPNGVQHSGRLFTGRFEDGVGYILIGDWSGRPADYEPLDRVLDELIAAGSPAVMIDIRPNAGGDEVIARRFAGRFVEKPSVYSLSRYRQGDGLGDPIKRIVEPRNDKPRFAGRVAVLTGPANMSSSESFILMMRHGAGARLFGAKTWGSSGNPKPHDLGHGLTVFLSSWQDEQPDGTIIEGRGVEPDESIPWPCQGAGRDPVLMRALDWARTGK